MPPRHRLPRVAWPLTQLAIAHKGGRRRINLRRPDRSLSCDARPPPHMPRRAPRVKYEPPCFNIPVRRWSLRNAAITPIRPSIRPSLHPSIHLSILPASSQSFPAHVLERHAYRFCRSRDAFRINTTPLSPPAGGLLLGTRPVPVWLQKDTKPGPTTLVSWAHAQQLSSARTRHRLESRNRESN